MAVLANDPIDLLIDDNNDLVITNGSPSFARGLTGIAQQCRIAVQMVAGEWFLNLDAGIDYFGRILAHGPPEVVELAAKQEFRDELLAIPGVLSIVQLDTDFDPQTRTLTVTWQVSTVLGNTPVDTLSQNGNA